jgi:hypothetical protein
MTNEANNTIVIDSHRASILHFALTSAIESTTEQIKLKSSAPFAAGIALLISSYKSEREKLEAAFPRLKPEQPRAEDAAA